MLQHEVKKKGQEILDNLIKVKGVFEVLDGPAIGIAINTLDNLVLDKINPAYYDRINSVLLSIMDLDFDGAQIELESMIIDMVKFPIIEGTALEQKFVRAILDLVTIGIEVLREKLENKDEEGD